MPRKVSYGVDFDEEYDAYDDYRDDYDYNHGNGIDEHETAWEPPVTKEEIVYQNVWRCPICTYDNDEYMSSCDICGVLRNPLIKSSNNGQSSTVVPNLEKPSTSDAPSNKKIENANLKSNPKSSNKSPPLISKDKPQQMENNNMTQTHKISNEFNNITMSGESGTSKIANKGKMGKTVSRSQYKPEKWMLLDEGEDRLSQLNLAIVGHVDSGKSTLSGRLLHLLGQISQKQMHKFEKEAKLQA